MIVLLDASPLGRATSPRASAINQECRQWLAQLLASGVRVLVPEITDYEVRRDLIRIRSVQGIADLDRLKAAIGYVPITTAAMLQAAEFWAAARQQGRPTAANAALDGDVILAAQAVILAASEGDRVVIATENVKHLSIFTDAEEWRKIQAPTP